MTNNELVAIGIKTAYSFIEKFIDDLSDEEMFVRPISGANHIAWQLGHLISAEAFFLSHLPGKPTIPLPEGFMDQYSGKTAALESRDGFLKTKKEYLELFKVAEEHVLKAVNHLKPSDFDTPITEGPMAEMCPTIGSLLAFWPQHTVMHVGQFSVIRRKLGKPILF